MSAAVTPDRDELPTLDTEALRDLADLGRRWVCWRYETRGGKPTKVPIRIDGSRASCTAPSTWSTYEDCYTAVVRGLGDGLGVVLTGDGLVGVDLDHVIDDAGNVSPEAQEIVDALDSYSEVSPSGTGLRVFARGELPDGRRKRRTIECYETERYLTVTGKHLAGTPDTIEDRTAALATFHAEHLGGAEDAERVEYEQRDAGNVDEMIRALGDADERVRRLLHGRHDDLGYPSGSEADYALACRLAGSGVDGAVIETALRWRRRGDGKDAQYFRRTVERALGAAKAEAEREAAGEAEHEDPRKPARLRVLSADEFEADVAPSALVRSLLYEGSVHSMNGASKAGKTWNAIQLAMAVNEGVPFLGLPSVASPVLYLSFELSAGMLRGRMREIKAGTAIAYPRIGETFHVVAPTASYVPQLDLGMVAGIAALERLIGETGSRLVVLDTLYRFLPGVDVNDNGEVGLIFGRLNDLASRTGAAVLLLDHVGKGEHTGPVSHSALGASVKGGSARVVIALRRTSRDDGGRWQLDVESHFGSWEEPLYYERPRLPDETRGGGCVLCSASEAHGMKFATVHRLFADYGERDAEGHAFFASKRKLIAALETAKLSSGNAQGSEIVTAIQRDYAIPEYLAGRHPDRPILTRDGDRNAVVFTWRMAEAPEEATTWI